MLAFSSFNPLPELCAVLGLISSLNANRQDERQRVQTPDFQRISCLNAKPQAHVPQRIHRRTSRPRMFLGAGSLRSHPHPGSLPVLLDMNRVRSVLELPFTEPELFWKLP